MALFALVDCNNFYVSCERVFRPELARRPVAVLSNNDGCVIARSAEVKELGVPLGAPAFQWAPFFKARGVVLFSSNYALYGDLSERVMQTMAPLARRMEVYSIDEAFLELPGPLEHAVDAARAVKAQVERWTGIPVAIGVGPSKTLAKAATRLAKKRPQTRGVFGLSGGAEDDAHLRAIEAGDVWGIGRRYAARLARLGIHDAAALKRLDPALAGRLLTVNGRHTVLELQGKACLPLQSAPRPKKAICSSRSFGRPVRERAELFEAVAAYAARAAEKLRSQDSVAASVSVFIHTNRFNKGEPQYANFATESLAATTNCTGTFVELAHKALARIFRPGYAYKKAGVLVSAIEPRTRRRLSLLDEAPDRRERAERLMHTLDKVNAKWGRNTLRPAAAGAGERPWRMRREMKSPDYTTRWEEIPVVKAG